MHCLGEGRGERGREKGNDKRGGKKDTPGKVEKLREVIILRFKKLHDVQKTCPSDSKCREYELAGNERERAVRKPTGGRKRKTTDGAINSEYGHVYCCQRFPF